MTAADIARAAFDELLSVIKNRLGVAAKHLHVDNLPELEQMLQHEFEQVLIRLQLIGMEATCLQLDLDHIRQQREEREAHERGRAIGGFGTDDHIDVTVIDPDDIE